MGTTPYVDTQFPSDDRDETEYALPTAREKDTLSLGAADERRNPIAASQYVLTEQDERELAIIRDRLATIARRIARLERDQPGEGLRESFPLGTGGPRRGGRWQSRKRFDASFEKARKLVPLYEERSRLQAKESALLSGARQAEREQEALREKRREAAASRVRAARVGDYVKDNAYGTVRVVRVNTQSLTVETEAGRREPRKFSLILDVAFTEAEIIDWFAKCDASGTFPIRPFVRAALAGDRPSEETAAWLRDETHRRYPLFIRNLPWQTIAQRFHEDEHQRLAEASEPGEHLDREGG